MMEKSAIIVFALGTSILSGCGGSSAETMQKQVADSFFASPQEVKFSNTFENSRKVCGFASGLVSNDRFAGPRPFWADADGGTMEIIEANAPEQFVINAARNCPDQFVDRLHDFPFEEFRASRGDNRQAVDQ